MAERGDSLRISTTTNFSRRLDKFSSSRFYQMTYIGVPLIVGGLIVKGRTTIFEVYVTNHLPRFNRHLVIICNMPLAAVMLGMKVSWSTKSQFMG